jgi:hypothetical protein
MSRFSERNGIRAAKAIQIDGMDSDLRTGLWNVVSPAFFVYKRDYGRDQPPGYWPWERELGVRVWRDFFKYPVDTMPARWNTVAAQIREWFFKATWYDVYDLVEFLGANAVDAGFNSENSMRFQETCNRMLEREAAGFRFLQGQLQAVTDPVELETVDTALDSGDRAVRAHLRQALALLSARPDPDYEGSIRSSMRAVQTLCASLGDETASLDDLLRRFAQESGPHNALRPAFNQLFGFKGDGVAELLMAQPGVGFDEAKFMLVSCAAFVSYLRVKTPLLDGTARRNHAAMASAPALPPAPAARPRR